MNCGEKRIYFPGETSAGVNFSAQLELPDYPAPDWVVSAILRGPAVINLQATGNGTGFTFSVAAAKTASWAPGEYWVSLRATNGGDVEEVARLQLTVNPDLAAASAGYDGRSNAEKALEAIKAVLDKRATRDQERYKINERELWRTPVPELLRLKSYYSMQVRRDRAAAKGQSIFGRPVMVRFRE